MPPGGWEQQKPLGGIVGPGGGGSQNELPRMGVPEKSAREGDVIRDGKREREGDGGRAKNELNKERLRRVGEEASPQRLARGARKFHRHKAVCTGG